MEKERKIILARLRRGSLIYLGFDRASATREGTGATRRIDLRFRARVQDDI